MKTLFKLTLIGLLLATVSLAARADIHVTIYGKGGVIYDPATGWTKICADYSTHVCCVITIPSPLLGGNDTGITGTLIYEGNSYNVQVMELPGLFEGPDGYECHGITVKYINP